MATAKKTTGKTTAKKPATKKTTKKKVEPEMPEDIWERLPNENTEQYGKFCAYRDMAYTDGRCVNKRSLRKLAVQLNLQAARPLELLSVKYDWSNRCDAYDRHMEQLAREAQESAIIKMREDHALLASQMIRKATKRLLTIPEDAITASDLVRLADVGVKIERLSRGESTENVGGSVAHKGTVKVTMQTEHDLADLSDEELGQLEQLLGKIHKKPGV